MFAVVVWNSPAASHHQRKKPKYFSILTTETLLGSKEAIWEYICANVYTNTSFYMFSSLSLVTGVPILLFSHLCPNTFVQMSI